MDICVPCRCSVLTFHRGTTEQARWDGCASCHDRGSDFDPVFWTGFGDVRWSNPVYNACLTSEFWQNRARSLYLCAVKRLPAEGGILKRRSVVNKLTNRKALKPGEEQC